MTRRALVLVGVLLHGCKARDAGTGDEDVDVDSDSDSDDATTTEPCAVPGAICTIAGVPGTLGHNGDGDQATGTWLYFPSALVWDLTGAMLINDFNNYRVRRLGTDGTLLTIVGRGLHGWAEAGSQATQSSLENVLDLSMGADGVLYMAELHTDRVMSVGVGGVIGLVAGSGEEGAAGDEGPAISARFLEPSGVGVGADGTVYISDSGNHVVRSVGPDRVVRLVLGDYTSGWEDELGRPRLNRPQRVRVDGQRLLVADTGNHVVRSMDLVTLDSVIIAGTGESGNSGDGGLAVDATLVQPTSAYAGRDGDIYVADAGAHVIRRIDASGVISTVAGVGTPGADGDGGPAVTASLNGPADILEGPDGALYVADMFNGTVRRIAP